jgi:hypothetical protein
MIACPRRSRQVEVSHIDNATERAPDSARAFSSAHVLAPAGWRSVVAVPEGGEFAFSQSKSPAAHSPTFGLR